MREITRARKKTSNTKPARNSRPIREQSTAARDVLAGKRLQQTLGNQAVQRLLHSKNDEFETSMMGTETERSAGMPSRLEKGLEVLSGMDFSDVRVHYNSSRPAQFDALAYTRGKNIFLSPGQEHHLPHEGWHVVQQEQGRVKATTRERGVSLNDDAALEREADVMGLRASRVETSGHVRPKSTDRGSSPKPVQRKSPTHRKDAPAAREETSGIDRQRQLLDEASETLEELEQRLDAHNKHLRAKEEAYQRQIIEQLKSINLRIDEFYKEAEKHTLDQLRPDIMKSTVGPITGATSTVVGSVGGADKTADKAWVVSGPAFFAAFIKVTKEGSKFAGLATGGITTVFSAGVDVYSNYEQNKVIDNYERMSKMRIELGGELRTEGFDLYIDYLYTEGSALYQLRSQELDGAFLLGMKDSQTKDIDRNLNKVETGKLIPPSDLAPELEQVKELVGLHETWKSHSEELFRQADRQVAEFSELTRQAYGRMLDLYANAGGTVPKGPNRAELARYRLEKRLRGKSGQIVPLRRFRKHAGRGMLVDGKTYHLTPRSRLRVGAASVGRQTAKVVGVEFGPMYRTLWKDAGEDASGMKQTGESDTTQRSENVERWYSDAFRIEIDDLSTSYTKVPDVEGLPKAEALERVLEAGLKPIPDYVYVHRGGTKGTATGTHPMAGRELAVDSVVRVYISD